MYCAAFWRGFCALSAERIFLVILAVLVPIDLVFVALHAFHKFSGHVPTLATFASWHFNLVEDFNYSEMYEYVKASFCMFAVLGCYRLQGGPVFIVISTVYLWVIMESALGMSKGFGRGISSLTPFSMETFGTFMALGVAGVVVSCLLLKTYRQTFRDQRGGAALCMLFIVLLAVFAVGVDGLRTLIDGIGPEFELVLGQGARGMVNSAFTLVEESGELLMLSFNCAVTVSLYYLSLERARSARGPVKDFY